MKNSFSQEQDSKSQRREVNNSKTLSSKNNQRKAQREISVIKSMSSKQLKFQCTKIGMKKEPLQAHTINQVVEAAGHSQLLVLVRHWHFYPERIKSFKNTQFSNCSIVTKVITLALEDGCMKVMNMLANMEF